MRSIILLAALGAAAALLLPHSARAEGYQAKLTVITSTDSAAMQSMMEQYGGEGAEGQKMPESKPQESSGMLYWQDGLFRLELKGAKGQPSQSLLYDSQTRVLYEIQAKKKKAKKSILPKLGIVGLAGTLGPQQPGRILLRWAELYALRDEEGMESGELGNEDHAGYDCHGLSISATSSGIPGGPGAAPMEIPGMEAFMGSYMKFDAVMWISDELALPPSAEVTSMGQIVELELSEIAALGDAAEMLVLPENYVIEEPEPQELPAGAPNS